MIKRVMRVLIILVTLCSVLVVAYSSKTVEARPVEVNSIPRVSCVPILLPVTIVVPIVYTCIESEEIEINEEELELLAHLIFAEAGSDWCSDELQQYTGSVALNRVASPYYPDNLYDVIYQRGQYSTAWNGMMEYEYNDRAYECAKFLLENGSVLPENVVFQAEFEQGDGTYKTFELTRGRKMYFCYKEKK